MSDLVETCGRAIEHWLPMDQIGVAQEECAELITDLSRLIAGMSHVRRGRLPLDGCAEEIADVIIMCEQLRQMIPEHVASALERKLARLNALMEPR
jgi:NTP pyrophosphatase (non-canonical NTP hydrolase)